jgi:hypothetical protein
MNKRLNEQSTLTHFLEVAQSRCAFRLVDGTYYEGYMIEVTEQDVIFYSGGPLAREAPYIFAIDQIDSSSLSYYDEHQQQWRDFHA